MHVNEYIQQEMARVRIMIDRTMEGMTNELFNWAPPGTANTISATFIHLINVEDTIIQKILQDMPSIWERDVWSEKTGIQKLPNIGEDWSDFKHRQISIDPLMEYKTSVWAATDVYLDNLKPEELDRMVTFSRGERSTADLIILSASQSLNHAGEIAVLKGIQGVKGFPH
jgi:hypothetical protein